MFEKLPGIIMARGMPGTITMSLWGVSRENSVNFGIFEIPLKICFGEDCDGLIQAKVQRP